MTEQAPEGDERLSWIEPDARWIEPEIRELDVSDTFGRPNRGHDADMYVDCTRS
jgi:hypothetical protein